MTAIQNSYLVINLILVSHETITDHFVQLRYTIQYIDKKKVSSYHDS